MTRIGDWLHSLRRPAEPEHPFDAAHGVDTSGLFYADKLPTGHAHDRYSEGYYATAPSLFYGALAQWQSTLPPIGLKIEDYSLIDLGCGKGRVVLMASGHPFRAVRGIELNAGLTRIARRNLRQWTRSRRSVCTDVRVDRGDVLELELPQGPVALFLFNSFSADVLAPLMDKLARSVQGPRAAPIDLIYLHPDHDALVAQTPGIELLRFAEIPFSYEDFAADVFGVSSDVCSVYRMRR